MNAALHAQMDAAIVSPRADAVDLQARGRSLSDRFSRVRPRRASGFQGQFRRLQGLPGPGNRWAGVVFAVGTPVDWGKDCEIAIFDRNFVAGPAVDCLRRLSRIKP